jgi:hypothetical protein
MVDSILPHGLMVRETVIVAVRSTAHYEYLTAFRDEKRATLSLLLPTPQDPTEDVSMTGSFVLTLYFNTLHVCFHVDGLERHQQHH